MKFTTSSFECYQNVDVIIMTFDEIEKKMLRYLEVF